MTVTYTSEVATSGFFCLLKLLFRWRGSIYKLLWKDSLVFFILYYFVMLLYYFALNDHQKTVFERVVLYFRTKTNHSLVVFVLGFYINIIITRWWNQVSTMPWPDKMAMFVTANITGHDDRGRLMRRTIMRYMCLAKVILLSSISPVVKKRFPSFHHMTVAGILMPSEESIMEKLKTPHNKYFVPLAWCSSLIQRARSEGRIKDDFAVKTLNDEVNNFRGMLGTLFIYDWIPIPLVYTHVVTVAVYVYTVFCILGNQITQNDSDELGIYFPLFAYLQYVFYMGYLKVAECLLNPFGEDDEDIDLNAIIDRNLQVSYLIVDEMHNEHPELIKDQYWDEIQFEMPYTEASAPFRRESYLGSAMKLDFKRISRLSKSVSNEEGAINSVFENDSAIWRQKLKPSTGRQYSESTIGSTSFRITMDGSVDKNKFENKYKCTGGTDGNDNSDTDGKVSPLHQDHCNDAVDATKGDELKVENQEVKNRLESTKTILEPLMESDEQKSEK